jgi:hypothetical protein
MKLPDRLELPQKLTVDTFDGQHVSLYLDGVHVVSVLATDLTRLVTGAIRAYNPVELPPKPKRSA